MHRNSIRSNDRIISTHGRTLDHAAWFYDILSPLMLFCQEKRISEKAIRLLNLSGVNKILDVGCGTGTVAIKIAKGLGYKNNSLIVGLDAALKMIDVARKKSKRLKNIRFDVEIAENLPYEDESFDAAISTFFFHHIDFELKKKALQEIWRVIKRNGAVVIVDIDIPVNLFGHLCAWCAYLMFRQEEIKENIQGKLIRVIAESKFRSWHIVSRHLGCISIFKLVK
ncbi:MAG: methyltransferase domain-containing protein [Nitrospirae bacterium]|nr:methyltransferase domain-containing protein [Nitrospirota bacterium]